jgi:hypothetical protein
MGFIPQPLSFPYIHLPAYYSAHLPNSLPMNQSKITILAGSTEGFAYANLSRVGWLHYLVPLEQR